MRTILSCLLITHFLHIINNCAEQEFDIIQSFDKYLLSTCYVPSTVLGAVNISDEKKKKKRTKILLTQSWEKINTKENI